MFKKILSLNVIICFFLTTLGPIPKSHADTVLGLPAPGTMVSLSPAYQPVIIKGLTVHKDNPFLFDFIVDVGQDRMSGESLKKEGEKLIKYFLASLAIPDRDRWVNLSPYEKNRMMPEALGQTDMGRDLLVQDYILKQITASLIYPEKDLGKKFWDKVYSKAQQTYGTTQIPVNTFNKVWIMADRAEVFEHNQTAFVVDQHLKVMLEEDYLAMQKHNTDVIPGSSTVIPAKATAKAGQAGIHSLGSQIVKQIILPELEKEVNTGKNFANLRQIFNSVILATWYKKNLKEALLNQVYTNQSKVKGIERQGVRANASSGVIASVAKQSQQDLSPEQIYEQYLKAYKKGVFNYIKEEVFPPLDGEGRGGVVIPRKYFSGGILDAVVDLAMTESTEELAGSVTDDPLVKMTVLANTGAQPNLTRAGFIATINGLVEEVPSASDANTSTVDSPAYGPANTIQKLILKANEAMNVGEGIRSGAATTTSSSDGLVISAIQKTDRAASIPNDKHMLTESQRQEVRDALVNLQRVALAVKMKIEEQRINDTWKKINAWLTGHNVGEDQKAVLQRGDFVRLEFKDPIWDLANEMYSVLSVVRGLDKVQTASISRMMFNGQGEYSDNLSHTGRDLFSEISTEITSMWQNLEHQKGAIEKAEKEGIDEIKKAYAAQEVVESLPVIRLNVKFVIEVKERFKEFSQMLDDILVPEKMDRKRFSTKPVYRYFLLPATDAAMTVKDQLAGRIKKQRYMVIVDGKSFYKIDVVTALAEIQEKLNLRDVYPEDNPRFIPLYYWNGFIFGGSYKGTRSLASELLLKAMNGLNGLVYDQVQEGHVDYEFAYRNGVGGLKEDGIGVREETYTRIQELLTAIKEIVDPAIRAGGERLNQAGRPKRAGGIDLNTSNGMQWKVSRDGRGVEMNIDPAMIARIRREGIDSLSPVIIKMTPVASIWPLVGLQAPA